MKPREAERLLEVIEHEANALIASMANSPTAAVQAQCVGMTALKDHLLRRLDFRDFASDEISADASTLRTLITKHCRTTCPASREIPSGQAAECVSCLLKQVSLAPIERQAQRTRSTT